MAQLAASIISHDEEFKRQAAQLLRACGVPVGIVEGRSGADGSTPDVSVIDIRSDVASGMAAIERLRAAHPSVAIFAVANTAEPDLILQAMRAGANEFFPWQPGGATQGSRAMEESFHGAVRRTAARRDAATAGARPPCVTHVFLGAKGGAGTTTVAVNCAVELARLSKRPTAIVDLKTCLGEVALFLGVRPRFTVLDAIENLHRLDRDFLRELVSKHKSGVDILAGSEQFDRPNAQDAGAIEELLRVLARAYDHIVIDAGNMINSSAVAALYAADTVFLVTNPDVPSIRNAQRLVDRVRQLGAGSERIKILLNRVSDNVLIAPKQIETALGYGIHHSFTSDYRTVSTALNSGVPLALTNSTAIAGEIDRFSRSLLGLQQESKEPEKRKPFLGLL
jgi:pilus assembly protein CpaE